MGGRNGFTEKAKFKQARIQSTHSQMVWALHLTFPGCQVLVDTLEPGNL